MPLGRFPNGWSRGRGWVIADVRRHLVIASVFRNVSEYHRLTGRLARGGHPHLRDQTPEDGVQAAEILFFLDSWLFLWPLLGMTAHSLARGGVPYLRRQAAEEWRGCNTATAPGNWGALDALLPDLWLAAHPEHRLEQREGESREAQARRRRKRVARRVALASQT